MNYKKLTIILFTLFFTSCDQNINQKTKLININSHFKYKNVGFALVYNENFEDIKELDPRSLSIYHKSLKKRSIVKITNLENGNSLLAEVKSNKIKFSNFYNSILSTRIAEVTY